jgi:Tfp pilus assembly protein PilX
MKRLSNSSGSAKHRQQGLVLIIALVVLAAMTLAAVSLARTVGAGNIAIGALAIRQTTAPVADIAINTAMWSFVSGQAFGPENPTATFADAPNTTNGTANYPYKAEYDPTISNQLGIPNILFHKNTYDTTYTTAIATSTMQSSGETGRFLIERMCDTSFGATGAHPGGLAASQTGCVMSVGTQGWTYTGNNAPGGLTLPLFRVTVRVDTENKTGSGAYSSHNATTFAQVVFHP